MQWRVIILFLSVLFPASIAAQVDAMMSQYYRVPSLYNPAATGLTDFVNINGGVRLEENLTTVAALADMPVKLAGKRLGIGISYTQEKFELYRYKIGAIQASYKIKLGPGTLSAGVQLGVIDQTFNGSELVDSLITDDTNTSRTDTQRAMLDFSLGAYYHAQNFWVSLSAPRLSRPASSLNAMGGNNGKYTFNTGRALYFAIGGNIPINNTLFDIQPSMLVKSNFSATTGEASARLRWRKLLSAGIGYRYREALTLLISAEVRDFYLGYNYDHPMSPRNGVTRGSHEIWAGYRLKLDLGDHNKHRQRSIRIM